jgi:hypothetical protein
VRGQLFEKIGHYNSPTDLNGAEHPFRVFLSSFRGLEILSDPAAEKVLKAAHDMLLNIAGDISDPEMQSSFRENVPAHREILLAMQS